MADTKIDGYRYFGGETNQSHSYLLPVVFREIDGLYEAGFRQLFELGCGNGSVANRLVEKGWNVTGVDPSSEGISHAHRVYPTLNIHQGSAYDDLVARYGSFSVLMSLEVVEHVYAPRHYARTAFDLLSPGGTAIFSTPFHGYWKNLVLALSGKMDDHFTALWDNGHIKFWSERTLATLLQEAGFINVRFLRAGRVPALAKSMIAVAQKP